MAGCLSTSRAVAGALGFTTALALSAGWGETRVVQRDARPSAPGAVIRGQVVGADTGTPLSDVVVQLESASEPPGSQSSRSVVPLRRLSATSDTGGRFELTGIPAGHYYLVAIPGPLSARYVTTRFPDPFSDDDPPLLVGTGQQLDNVVLPVRLGAAISGRVVDERGVPMAMVMVTAAETLPGRRPRAQGPIAWGDRTDDLGNFRLYGFAPGEYLLVAYPLMGPSIAISGSTRAVVTGGTDGFIPTYYPSASSPADALAVRLRSGEQHGPIEFVLTRTRSLRVSGVVLDPRGEPVPAAMLTLQTERTPLATLTSITAPSQPDGTFTFERVPPGQYTLTTTRPGSRNNRAQYGWMPLTVSDDIEGLTVTIQSAVHLRGRVVFEGTAPDSLSGMLVRSTGTTRGVLATGVQPEADGSFVLENLTGPTLIRVDEFRDWHLQAVFYGGRDVTDEPIEFTREDLELQVVLTQRDGVLTGLVVNGWGQAVDGAVLVFPYDPRRWHEQFSFAAYAGGNGQFRVHGIRPGRYLAVAVPRDDASLSDVPAQYFELLAKHATAVVLAEGETRQLNLRRALLRD